MARRRRPEQAARTHRVTAAAASLQLAAYRHQEAGRVTGRWRAELERIQHDLTTSELQEACREAGVRPSDLPQVLAAGPHSPPLPGGTDTRADTDSITTAGRLNGARRP